MSETNNSLWKKIQNVLVVVLAAGLLFVMLRYNIAEQLVAYLGPKGSYGAVFLLAATTGVSFLTSSAFYATIISIAAASTLHPVLLATSAGLGLFISDSILYFVIDRFAHLFPEHLWNKAKSLGQRLQDRYPKLIQVFVYLYAGFSPFPGDVLMLALATINYPFRKFWWPLLLGNVTFILTLSLLGRFGITVFGF